MPADIGSAVRIDGLAEIQRSFRKMDKDLGKQVRLVLNEVADKVVDRAADLVPERSGDAKRSLKAKSTATLVRAAGGSARVPYYGWLEFGGWVGSFGHPRTIYRPILKDGRYLYPTYYDMKRSGEFLDLLEQAMESLIEKAGLYADGQ